MPVAATIPVRLPAELLARLDAWAVSKGVSRSAAIKLCLGQQLGVIADSKPESLRGLDGRTHRYKTKIDTAFDEAERLAKDRRASAPTPKKLKRAS